MIKRCPACGKQFGATAKYPEQIYCCRACYWQSKANVKFCPICGNNFKPTSSKQRYCSRACYEASREAAQEIAVCIGCGKRFIKRAVRKKQYCTLACANKHHAHPPHKHRKTVPADRERGANWVTQRRAAKRRDGYQCQMCGIDVRTLKHGQYGVHHIAPYKAFNGDYVTANQLTNLVTLCRKCHNKVEHHGYPCPQPLF